MGEIGTNGFMFASFCQHFQCDLALFWERKEEEEGGRSWALSS